MPTRRTPKNRTQNEKSTKKDEDKMKTMKADLAELKDMVAVLVQNYAAIEKRNKEREEKCRTEHKERMLRGSQWVQSIPLEVIPEGQTQLLRCQGKFSEELHRESPKLEKAHSVLTKEVSESQQESNMRDATSRRHGGEGSAENAESILPENLEISGVTLIVYNNASIDEMDEKTTQQHQPSRKSSCPESSEFEPYETLDIESDIADQQLEEGMIVELLPQLREDTICDESGQEGTAFSCVNQPQQAMKRLSPADVPLGEHDISALLCANEKPMMILDSDQEPPAAALVGLSEDGNAKTEANLHLAELPIVVGEREDKMISLLAVSIKPNGDSAAHRFPHPGKEAGSQGVRWMDGYHNVHRDRSGDTRKQICRLSGTWKDSGVPGPPFQQPGTSWLPTCLGASAAREDVENCLPISVTKEQ